MDNLQLYLRIKDLIDKNGINNNKLLTDCKINSSFLNDLKTKNVKPSIEKILKIADYFNVSLDYLIKGSNTINNSTHQELLDLYSKLNAHEQEVVLSLVKILCSYK